MNPEQTTFTAWITKYSLTKGVFSTKVEDCFKINETMVSDTERPMVYYHDNDWHRTREAAVQHAEKMRKKKIVSLKNSIGRIKKLKFGD